MTQITRQSASFHRVICAISSCKVTGIVLHLIINYVNISNKPSAVTNVVICNAVGVVPMIAQG